MAKEKSAWSVAWGVFLGLFTFFVVLPLATCAACTTCAGGIALTSNLGRDDRREAPAPAVVAEPPVVLTAPTPTPIEPQPPPAVEAVTAPVVTAPAVTAPVVKPAPRIERAAYVAPVPKSYSAPAPQPRCCVVCSKGQACGNSCISRSKQCHKPPGCACDG